MGDKALSLDAITVFLELLFSDGLKRRDTFLPLNNTIFFPASIGKVCVFFSYLL